MGAIVELFLFIVLCASVSGVQGACRHVKNDDMIEYFCIGGQISDLNDLPVTTGKIKINNMPIRRITAETFSRFGPDLWVLVCSHCNIMDIEPGAFQHLNNLQQLTLNNNRLTTVKESWFKGLDYLTFLDLNYNSIESIEDGVFKNLPSLVDMRLSGNRLECLNIADLSNLKELKRIFLTENSHFKCPNAVSMFLESRGVDIEKDPEWNRIETDLISAESPFEYDMYDEETTTEEPTTPLPAHRERLRPTATTQSPTVASTASHIPLWLYTTEEVVYHPMQSTPDWRVTPKASTIPPEDKLETTSAMYQYTSRPYVPPATIAPIDSTTYPPPESTSYVSQETTTLRSWPKFPEPTAGWPEYPIYPYHKNEDEPRTEQSAYSSSTESIPLAVSPDDLQTPPYVEPDVEHSTQLPQVDWFERNTGPSNVQYLPSTIESRGPEFQDSAADSSTSGRDVQPLPPAPPTMIHPPSPDNVFQPPYYEHPVTLHSPPLVGNQPQHEEVSPKIILIETTTDKPLPDCPNRSPPSSTSSTPVAVIVSVFLIAARHVFVEGF
ncbi:uncharacterized protein LOC143428110 [Xylocopa sonorina]|uniref:uncharacterized protein LOC143428110 n=1 Tax=Xylocopa sonorina TaxID=1818115 RepID=UPI00403ACF8B